MTIGSGTSEIRQRIKRKKKERKKETPSPKHKPAGLAAGRPNQPNQVDVLTKCVYGMRDCCIFLPSNVLNDGRNEKTR